MSRKRPPKWGFYVYEIGSPNEPLYIGKGCGDRLKTQEKRFKAGGREIARFVTEDDAYQFEAQLVQELKPVLNKAPGGIKAGRRTFELSIPETPASLIQIREWARTQDVGV